MSDKTDHVKSLFAKIMNLDAAATLDGKSIKVGGMVDSEIDLSFKIFPDDAIDLSKALEEWALSVKDRGGSTGS